MREDLNPWDAESVQDSDLLDLQLASDWSPDQRRSVVEALQGARSEVGELADAQDRVDDARQAAHRADKTLELAMRAHKQASSMVEGLLERVNLLDPDGDTNAAAIKDGLTDVRLALSEIEDEIENARNEFPEEDGYRDA